MLLSPGCTSRASCSCTRYLSTSPTLDATTALPDARYSASLVERPAWFTAWSSLGTTKTSAAACRSITSFSGRNPTYSALWLDGSVELGPGVVCSRSETPPSNQQHNAWHLTRDDRHSLHEYPQPWGCRTTLMRHRSVFKMVLIAVPCPSPRENFCRSTKIGREVLLPLGFSSHVFSAKMS